MRKFILSLLIIFCLLSSSNAYAKKINVKILNKEYKADTVNVNVDGVNKVSKDMPSFIYMGRTLSLIHI